MKVTYSIFSIEESESLTKLDHNGEPTSKFVLEQFCPEWDNEFESEDEALKALINGSTPKPFKKLVILPVYKFNYVGENI